jgi:hypothetical protein
MNHLAITLRSLRTLQRSCLDGFILRVDSQWRAVFDFTRQGEKAREEPYGSQRPTTNDHSRSSDQTVGGGDRNRIWMVVIARAINAETEGFTGIRLELFVGGRYPAKEAVGRLFLTSTRCLAGSIYAPSGAYSIILRRRPPLLAKIERFGSREQDDAVIVRRSARIATSAPERASRRSSTTVAR